MITVRWACGHPTGTVDPMKDHPPVCPVCGERRISVVRAPAPQFRGLCVGPHATRVALEAVAVPMPSSEGKESP